MKSIANLTKAQSILFWCGLAFLVSGVFHIGVWLGDGAPSLTGPVSWRKPIVFGLSTGLLSMSLAWVVGLLPQTQRLVRQATLYAVLLILEIALITLQQWRGVGSHFNSTTPLDGAIFTTMGVLIVCVAVLITIWSVAVFKPLQTTPAYALAARAGLVFLNLGNVLGVFLAVWGSTQLPAGLEPNVFGAAGQLKVPHAVALHAIQVLPLIALVVSLLPRLDAYAFVRTATIVYAAVFFFTVLQTFSGRAPLDLTAMGIGVLSAAAIWVGWTLLRAIATLRYPRVCSDGLASSRSRSRLV